MEVIKPQHVALCVLSSMLFYPDELDPVFPPKVQHKLRDILTKEVRRVDRVAYPSLAGLLRNIQAELGEGDETAGVVTQLQEHMGRHFADIECPDDLLTLNRLVGDMITNSSSMPDEANAPGADCNTHLGIFFRECYTAFEFMPFEAVCKLMADCQQHLRASAGQVAGWEDHLPLGDRADEGLGKAGRQGVALRTHVELERSLNYRIRQAELEVGTAPREELEAELGGADVAAQAEPKVLLARHVSAVAHADLTAALDLLHHYFDFAGRGQSDWVGKTTVDIGTARAQERGRVQSAALSLGLAHARLGHTEEALQALNETVRIAQQSSDDVCLCHALAALCFIVEATTPGTMTSVAERRGAAGATPAARHYAQLAQLLQRCLARSEELHLPHLVAFSRLALARFALLHPQDVGPGLGDSWGTGAGAEGSSGAPPAAAALAVQDAVRDSAHLHLAAELAAVVIQPLPMSTGRPAAKMQRGIPDLFAGAPPVFLQNTLGSRASCAASVEQYAGSAHLLASASWQLAGAPALALAHSAMLLDSYADCGTADDQCAALAQLATCVAALHGYRAAERVLEVADARFPHKQSKQLRACRLAIAHDRALRRRELRTAHEIAAQLAALASPSDNTEIELRFEAEERAVRTLAAQGQAEAAAAAAQRLFSAASEAGQTLPAVRILLLLARVHWGAGAPLLALPYLLSCRSHCRQLHLDVLGAEAAVLLAQIWVTLGHAHAQHAQREVEAALPLLLAHGSLEARAQAIMALAEIVLAKHASAAGVAAESPRVLELLGEATAAAEAIEDWATAAHCHHLAALVREACGQQRERDAEAAACLRLRQLGAEGLQE